MIDTIQNQVCSAFSKPLRIEFQQPGSDAAIGTWTMEQCFDADDVNRALRHLADWRRRFPKRNYRLIALAFEEVAE